VNEERDEALSEEHEPCFWCEAPLPRAEEDYEARERYELHVCRDCAADAMAEAE